MAQMGQFWLDRVLKDIPQETLTLDATKSNPGFSALVEQYKKHEGVNSFLMLNMQESLNLSPEYVLIGFIFRFGAPKEIRVSNIIVEAGIEQICDVCGIKIRRIKRLKGLEEFKDSYTIEKYYFENREQKLGETYGYFLINIWIFSD